MATTQTRHDDIVIQRRIRTHGATHARGLSLWYEESPQSGRRTLVKSFRD